MLATCNSKIVKNVFEEKRYVSPYIILKWGLDKNIPIGELSFKLKDEEQSDKNKKETIFFSPGKLNNLTLGQPFGTVRKTRIRNEMQLAGRQKRQ